MAAADVHALVQEYIPGPPDRHYFVDGYLDRGAALRAVFVRRRTRMFPVSFGNSSHMVTVPPASAERAVQDVVRLLIAIGYRGVFSAEFKHDPRDEVFKLLEVNARPWWYIGFAADCGVDMCRLSYRDALGLDLETVSGYRAGERCVLFHLDVKAYLHERRTRGLTLTAWLRSVVGARPTVFSWDDPRPTLTLVVGMATRRFRSVFPRQLGKLFRRGG
jgi:predicted ATP-grasp superfamily ATP-dependent carboligase